MTGIWEFGVDIGGREYLSSRHTYMGFYMLFGTRAGALRWTYALGPAAPTINDCEAPPSDGIFLLTPYLGVGASIVQAKPLHLGASITWGPRFTLFKTFEGYENDVFRDVGELRLNLEASLFF